MLLINILWRSKNVAAFNFGITPDTENQLIVITFGIQHHKQTGPQKVTISYHTSKLASAKNDFSALSISILTVIFQVNWYQNVAFWILLELRVMEVVVTAGAIRRAKLQSNRHHQQTNIQLLFFTGRMPFLSPNQEWDELIKEWHFLLVYVQNLLWVFIGLKH